MAAGGVPKPLLRAAMGRGVVRLAARCARATGALRANDSIVDATSSAYTLLTGAPIECLVATPSTLTASAACATDSGGSRAGRTPIFESRSTCAAVTAAVGTLNSPEMKDPDQRNAVRSDKNSMPSARIA